jgi:hypothetical protein
VQPLEAKARRPAAVERSRPVRPTVRRAAPRPEPAAKEAHVRVASRRDSPRVTEPNEVAQGSEHVAAEESSRPAAPQPDQAQTRKQEDLDDAVVEQDNSGPGGGGSVDTGADESDGSSDRGGGA